MSTFKELLDAGPVDQSQLSQWKSLEERDKAALFKKSKLVHDDQRDVLWINDENRKLCAGIAKAACEEQKTWKLSRKEKEAAYSNIVNLLRAHSLWQPILTHAEKQGQDPKLSIRALRDLVGAQGDNLKKVAEREIKKAAEKLKKEEDPSEGAVKESNVQHIKSIESPPLIRKDLTYRPSPSPSIGQPSSQDLVVKFIVKGLSRDSNNNDACLKFVQIFPKEGVFERFEKALSVEEGFQLSKCMIEMHISTPPQQLHIDMNDQAIFQILSDNDSVYGSIPTIHVQLKPVLQEEEDTPKNSTTGNTSTPPATAASKIYDQQKHDTSPSQSALDMAMPVDDDSNNEHTPKDSVVNTSTQAKSDCNSRPLQDKNEAVSSVEPPGKIDFVTPLNTLTAINQISSTKSDVAEVNPEHIAGDSDNQMLAGHGHESSVAMSGQVVATPQEAHVLKRPRSSEGSNDLTLSTETPAAKKPRIVGDGCNTSPTSPTLHDDAAKSLASVADAALQDVEMSETCSNGTLGRENPAPVRKSMEEIDNMDVGDPTPTREHESETDDEDGDKDDDDEDGDKDSGDEDGDKNNGENEVESKPNKALTDQLAWHNADIPEYVDRMISEEDKKPPQKVGAWKSNNLSTIGRLVLELSHDDDPNPSTQESPPIEEGEITETSDQNMPKESEEDIQEEKNGKAQKAVLEKSEKLQLDEDVLRRMYEFFRISIDESKDDWKCHDTFVMNPLFRRPLMVHQAYAVFWTLEREELPTKLKSSGFEVRPSGFTLLADHPGLGKSAVVGTEVVLVIRLRQLRREITECRLSSDPMQKGKHLPKSTKKYTQPLGATCPSQTMIEIQCPCVEAGVSASFDPPAGATVMLVPNSLTLNALQEWFEQVDMVENKLDIRLFLQVSNYGPKKTPIAIPLMYGDEKKLVPIQTFEATKEQIEESWDANDMDVKDMPETVIITCPPAWKGKMENTGLDKIPYGKIIRDEFHQFPNITNSDFARIRKLICRRRQLPDRRTPRVTFMSGTPLRLGLRDWLGIASIWTLLILANLHEVDKIVTDTLASQSRDEKWNGLVKNNFPLLSNDKF